MRRIMAACLFAVWCIFSGTIVTAAMGVAEPGTDCYWIGGTLYCSCDGEPCPPPSAECFEEDGVWYCPQ